MLCLELLLSAPVLLSMELTGKSPLSFLLVRKILEDPKTQKRRRMDDEVMRVLRDFGGLYFDLGLLLHLVHFALTQACHWKLFSRLSAHLKGMGLQFQNRRDYFGGSRQKIYSSHFPFDSKPNLYKNHE